ncbi:hypothetical protein INR49_031398 [Caranx melampygus]|nr:hypothetical protein INR49_031398 [Caranx melampygus]
MSGKINIFNILISSSPGKENSDLVPTSSWLFLWLYPHCVHRLNDLRRNPSTQPVTTAKTDSVRRPFLLQ